MSGNSRFAIRIPFGQKPGEENSDSSQDFATTRHQNPARIAIGVVLVILDCRDHNPAIRVEQGSMAERVVELGKQNC